MQLDFACVSLGDSIGATIQLSNVADDPLSMLHVTGITISGAGFLLAQGPLPPIYVPGDTTVVDLLIRFRPLVSGSVSGTLTITASNATNSPYSVPLTGGTCGPDEWQSVTGEY